MSVKLIYEQNNQNCRLATLNNDELTEVEFYDESRAHEGNIYLGRIVKKIELANGKTGYFLDIGDSRDAFINGEEPELEDLMAAEGQSVVVQICQEQRAEKGAKLTRALQFVGENLVYCPYRMDIEASCKIEDKLRVENLVSLVEENMTGQEGWIIRTSAADAADKVVVDEMAMLRKKFDDVLDKTKQVKSPALLMERNNCLEDAFLRNRKHLEGIVLNNHNLEEKYKDKTEVTYCTNPFKEFGIDEAIDDALQKEVRLKNGGRITIEETRACTAIDVDSGDDNGKGSLGRLNIEAAFEIAKQIRLRNLSGKIIVDFAGTSDYKYLKNAIDILEQELRKDYIKSTVFGLSRGGNVEIVRVRRRPTLRNIMTEECPTCRGTGSVEK
ncbi:MAG: ribonuclease E/G [Proteobacteria bacterium]|nr:ribonuclease E/G [Pseudomonadota bacterium]